jgi:hypothetical protein
MAGAMGSRAGVVLPAVRRGGRQTVAAAGRLAWGTVRDGLVDMHGLARGTRALLAFGYSLVLLGLASVLLDELVPRMFSRLPRLQAQFFDSSPQLLMVYHRTSGPFWWLPAPLGVMFEQRATATIPLLIAAIAVFIVGWGLVLTGASDCGRRVFLPLLALYGLHLLLIPAYLGHPLELGLGMIGLEFLALSAGDSPRTLVALEFLAVLLVAAPAGLYVMTHASERWRRYPILEFAGWVLATPCFIAVLILAVPTMRAQDRLAVILPVAVEFAYLGAAGAAWLGMLLSFLVGVDTVTLAVESGEAVAHRLRRRVAEGTFHRLVVILILVAVTLAIALFVEERVGPADVLNPNTWYFLIVFDLPPILIAAWTFWHLRRHERRGHAAVVGAALTIGWLIWLAAALVARLSGGQDFVGAAVSAPGVLPPGTLFVVLATYSVMTFGARFVRLQGKPETRGERALFYLGVVLLSLGALVFMSAQRIQATHAPNLALQTLYDNLSTVGLFLVAPLYFAWTFWRRRLWRQAQSPERQLGSC